MAETVSSNIFTRIWIAIKTGVKRAFEYIKSQTSVQSMKLFFTAFLGWFLIFWAGYYLSYQLFFTQTQIKEISYNIENPQPYDFRFDGVVYFHGNQLKDGDSITFEYFAPRLLGKSSNELEIFVETGDDREPWPKPTTALKVGESGLNTSSDIGKLIFSGLTPDGPDVVIGLDAEELQRFIVGWKPQPKENNSLTVTYQAGPSARDHPIAFATNIHTHLYGYVIFYALLGLIVLFFAYPLVRDGRQNYNWKHLDTTFLGALGLAIFAFYIHSGAFISLELFQGHYRIGAKASRLAGIIETGHLRASASYESVGMQLLPVLLLTVEQTTSSLFSQFTQIYPTTKYLIFSLFLAGTLFMGSEIKRLFSASLAVLFCILTIIHYPLILDLYDAHSDAYFLFVFPIFVALFLRLITGYGSRFWTIFFMCLCMVFVGALKPNMAFVILTVPLSVIVAGWNINRRQALVIAASIFVALTFSKRIGGAIDTHFQSPDRNVGIEGEAFYDGNFWAMVYAAYGHLDPYSAHWFAKGGAERNQRLSDRLGMENKGLIRHSDTANKQVYIPDTKNALKERPGYFYSTAYLRTYLDGLKFYKYTYGKDEDQFWLKWADHGNKGWEVISGQKVRGSTPERDLIRYGKAWKISPLLFLAKITQVGITKFEDWVLLLLAISGLFLVKNNGIRVFFISAVFVQIAFSSGLHGLNRYFSFVDFILLFGFAYFLYLLYESLANMAKPVHYLNSRPKKL